MKLGMEKARAGGRNVGRPVMAIDRELVLRLRSESRSWREIAEAHPPVKLPGGKVKPSVGSIRRAYEAFQSSR